MATKRKRGISDKAVRAAWIYWGGSFPGTNAESCAIVQKRMFSFAREMWREGIAAAKRNAPSGSGES